MLNETLKILRNKSGKTQLDVSKIIGVERSTYALYESGMRTPDYTTLGLLADLYNCTIDYLVGRVDEPNLVHYKLPDVDGMKIAVDIVQDALNEGLSPEDIKKVVALAKDMKSNSKKD